MRVTTVFFILGCVALAALPALAQGLPTGTLSGRVTAGEGALPGVVVTASSPALQGVRTTTTTEAGDFLLPLLPPGEYTVSFELQDLQPARRMVRVSAAQTAQLDVEMTLAPVAEQLQVLGSTQTIAGGSQSATTLSRELVEALPVLRDIRDSVLLNAGVADTGPGASARLRNVSIAGALSYETLYLFDGAVLNENLRGQPRDLFIEDGIAETTTSVTGIPAEFGRFAGGVVNTITKSGGNELEGSFRTSFSNDRWSQPTPVTLQRGDEINKRYEATLGGALWRDRIWFFLAGRQFEESDIQQTAVTQIPFQAGDKELRMEGKLTLSPLPGHRLVGSYLDLDRDDFGNRAGTVLDLASVNDRELPEEIKSFNYTGVLADNFFVEGQYAARDLTFVGTGSRFTDLIRGTLLFDASTGFRWNSATFCGVCTPEERNNESYGLKGSWFLSNERLGAHDVSLGYDYFDDVRVANNHQSGSDYRLFINGTIVRNGTELYPQIIGAGSPNPAGSTLIAWNPIQLPTQGTSFATHSLFLNDRWRLNDHWSFNVGVRWDKNDGTSSEGQTVAKDDRLSPRLGATYDLRGDGDWLFNAAYGHYVTSIANAKGDKSSRGGNPGEFDWVYRGPDINADPNAANLIPADQALQMVFDWFDSVGGTANQEFLTFVILQGGSIVTPGSLESPYTEETTVGFSKRLGNRGLFRADLVHRESFDFYTDRRDLSTGQTTLPSGQLEDVSFIENGNAGLRREYDGLHTQLHYRLGDRLTLGGAYTLSATRGNIIGETRITGPVGSIVGNYPEYKEKRWNDPDGYLPNDQRHRLRLFGVYNLLDGEHHRLDLSMLQSYSTGLPYGAVGAVNSSAFVGNPGYARPPLTVAYYYSGRDAFRTDDVMETDLGLNYSFRWNAFGKGVEVFLQPEIVNVFDEQAVLNVNTSVRDATTSPFRCPAANPGCRPGDPGATGFLPFNPFTDTPVEGPSGSGANWQRGASFGKPVAEEDYQQPRTFRFSVGLRF